MNLHLLIDLGWIVLLFGGLCATIIAAADRASKDWPYQLRVVRTLNVLAALEMPGELVDLSEVVITESHVSAGSVTIAFAPSDCPFDIGLLELDAPLGEFRGVLFPMAQHSDSVAFAE